MFGANKDALKGRGKPEARDQRVQFRGQILARKGWNASGSLTPSAMERMMGRRSMESPSTQTKKKCSSNVTFKKGGKKSKS